MSTKKIEINIPIPAGASEAQINRIIENEAHKELQKIAQKELDKLQRELKRMSKITFKL